MKNNLPLLQTLMQNYFLQRLIQQRKASPKTVESYRDTFRIYFEYLLVVHSIKATDSCIENFDLTYIEGFCIFLENQRGNKAVTINNRLAAIRSFLQYVAEIEPEYSGIAKRGLMMPMRKHETVTMDFVDKNEFDAMLATCNTATFIGARDKLMLMIFYNTGVRVSELLEIKCADIQNGGVPGKSSISIYGKGRKERIVPLWKDTALYIQRYIRTNRLGGNEYLFVNKNGNHLTRSGVRVRINIITKEASRKVQSLSEKSITPHSFRHSVAMNLLRAGVDISTIALWLGHSSIETTHKYMVADIELKRKAMEKAGSSGDASFNYKPSSDILNFLASL